MEELWKKMRNPKKQVEKKTCPNDWTANDLLSLALKNTNSESLSSMAVQFNKLLQGDDEILYPLPPKNNCFKTIKDGVMEEVYVNAEEHGLHCLNPAHQESTNNIKMETHHCEICHRTGPPTTQKKKQWSLPKLIPIIYTKPIFMVVLVSRSSSGQIIPQELYDNLRQTIVTQQRHILDFLKLKTGLDYDIHIIAEIGHNGSIFALLSDCDTHVRKTSDQERIPASHISDLFFFNRTSTTMVGYMTNSPGELTGKIANHYNNLHYLEKGGIKSSSVVFMANGVHVVQGKGVVPDFTMFTGEELIETTKPHVENNFLEFPYSTEPTVEGYVTGMTIDAGSRLVRTTYDRKKLMKTN